MPSDCASQCSERIYVRPTKEEAKTIAKGLVNDLQKLLSEIPELEKRKSKLESEIARLESLKGRIKEELMSE